MQLYLPAERVTGIMDEIRGPAGRNMWEKLSNVQEEGTHPTSAVLSDGWYFAKRVTLSLALRSPGDAGRGVGRVGAAAALVAG